MITHLERRYLVTGTLEFDTPVHIGGSDTLQGSSDQPVLRTPDGVPYIPGSSLKGAFRSTVEKLASTLGRQHIYQDVIDQNSPFAKTFRQQCNDQKWDDATTYAQVQRTWPATAHLFGTPYTAGKISFTDATLLPDQEYIVQRRDGVAIDRDSERAADNLLYNYEVVPGSLCFHFELRLENPTDIELGLMCLGLSELRSGFFHLGGKRTSGLGRCHLRPRVQIFLLDLQTADVAERLQRLKQYLIGTQPAEKFTAIDDFGDFINTSIDNLITSEERGAQHVESTGE